MEQGKKYIHYCWFGDKKLPRLAKKCIRSWKKYLPDYEVVCWNEKNVNLEECPFIKEAYEAKKWAFVADYARVKALYEYGGVYFDTDMLLKKDISFLLKKPAFVGVEDSGYVAAGVWGAKSPKSFLAGEVLKFYKRQAHFNDGDLYAITIPVIMTRILEKRGFSRNVNNVQVVEETYIYPREYFYPLSYDYENNIFTKNTCMVHYSDGSWTSKTEKRDIWLIRRFGRKRTALILKVAHSVKALVVYYGRVVWRTITLLLFPLRFLLRKMRHKKTENLSSIASKIKEANKNYVVFIHGNWMGVESATKALFGETIVIPDFTITDNLEPIARAIVDNPTVELVIFSAFGGGWEYLAKKIREAKPGITIKVFWHGGNAMHSESFDFERFRTIFGLLDQHTIDSIAFAKKSMYEQYKKLGYKVEFLPNTFCLDEDMTKAVRNDVRAHDGVRIGIYVSGDRWVKNLYNQMAAASLIEGAEIDMVPLTDAFMQFAKILKIAIGGKKQNIPREELFGRILEDDIVLYTTFTDCAPILPLECLELGVPCITGDNHHYFAGTPLEKYLVEPKVDDPVAIAERIKECLKHREEIMKLYKNWKSDYDKYCKKELKKFLVV